jgi:hypothetical protein
MIPLLFTVSLAALAVIQIEGLRVLRWRREFLASLPDWQVRMPPDAPSARLVDELWKNRLQ